MTRLNGSNGSATNGHTKVVIDPQAAISPSAPGELPRLVKEIQSSSQDYISGDTTSRLKLLEAARSLVYAMETPQETMLRYCWAQVYQFGPTRYCGENANGFACD